MIKIITSGIFLLLFALFGIWYFYDGNYSDLSDDQIGQTIQLEVGQFSWPFTRRGDVIYCHDDLEMKEVDIDSFLVYENSSYLAKDKNHVYCAVVDCVDVVGGCFCHSDYIIDGADPQTFEYLGNEYATDVNSVYYFCYPIEVADPWTFVYLDSFYAKDKNNAYTFGQIIEGADPKTFQYLGSDFSRDDNNVYYFDQVIEEADPQTFMYVGFEFGKDKNNVYRESQILTEVDGGTFEILNRNFFRDKNSVFWNGHPQPSAISGVDSKTFEIIETGDDHNYYVKDKYKVYYIQARIYYSPIMLIEGADPETFELLNPLISKDKSNAYYIGNKIEGVDIETFRLTEGGGMIYSEDKNHRYKQLEIME